jgi:hypothetical protein
MSSSTTKTVGALLDALREFKSRLNRFTELNAVTRGTTNVAAEVIFPLLKLASDCCPLSSVELTQPFGESARLKLSSSFEEPWPSCLLLNNLNYRRKGKWLNCVIDESRSGTSHFGGDQDMDLSLYRNVFSAKKSCIEGPCTRADHCRRCTERRQHN